MLSVLVKHLASASNDARFFGVVQNDNLDRHSFLERTHEESGFTWRGKLSRREDKHNAIDDLRLEQHHARANKDWPKACIFPDAHRDARIADVSRDHAEPGRGRA